jgi:hypothetical protein
MTYYEMTEAIKNSLKEDKIINTVTIGDLYDVDLDKQTLFPLSHIIVNNSSIRENNIAHNISILFMDVVDLSKELIEDKFLSNDNLQDVLNTQFTLAQRLVNKMYSGDLFGRYVEIENAGIEYFAERFTNHLAGVTLTVDILVPNTMTIC